MINLDTLDEQLDGIASRTVVADSTQSVQRHEVPYDGMPDKFCFNVWLNDRDSLTEYTRSDLCPPADETDGQRLQRKLKEQKPDLAIVPKDVLREVVEALEDCLDYCKSQVCWRDFKEAEQALAALSPYIVDTRN